MAGNRRKDFIYSGYREIVPYDHGAYGSCVPDQDAHRPFNFLDRPRHGDRIFVVDQLSPMESAAAKSVGDRYIRFWQGDPWHVVAVSIGSWVLDGLLLAVVRFVRTEGNRHHDFHVIYTLYSLVIYVLHVSYILSPLTSTKFSALIMAGNMAIFTGQQSRLQQRS
jgi:hypothetical protein